MYSRVEVVLYIVTPTHSSHVRLYIRVHQAYSSTRTNGTIFTFNYKLNYYFKINLNLKYNPVRCPTLSSEIESKALKYSPRNNCVGTSTCSLL